MEQIFNEVETFTRNSQMSMKAFLFKVLFSQLKDISKQPIKFIAHFNVEKYCTVLINSTELSDHNIL